MECFRCGSPVAGNPDKCLNCGQDLSNYKKAVWASNVYYNTGLERARADDLSGAILALKQSLSLNKMNIDARNLLGLVYYRMGELADAVHQWSVSRSYKLKDNPASGYIAELRTHKGRYDYFAKAVVKYNQAIGCAREGNKDMALLQVKKVIGMNPTYVKPYLLLALLYIDKGEYTKADKTLKRVLKIDCKNSTALRYMREIKGTVRKNAFASLKIKKKDRPEDDPFDESHISDKPIVPTYTETSDNWHAVALLLFGLIAGALFFSYLILPSVKKSMNNDFNKTIVSYSENLAAKDGEITGLNNKISGLQSDIDALNEELGSYSADSGILSSYNKLLDVLMALRGGDYLGALNSMAEVNASIVTNERFQQIYNALNEEFTVNGVSTTFNMGVAFYDAGDYQSARSYLEKCVSLQPDYPDALYRLGLACVNLGDREAADSYFTQVIDNYPGTELASQAMVMRGY